MADAECGRLSVEGIQMEERSPLKSGISLDSNSDVSYRDNLDDEPFNEKDRRFVDEPNMEDGDGEGFPVEPRRVSLVMSGSLEHDT